MVPPRGRMPRQAWTSSGMVVPSITPRQPSRKPTSSSPNCSSPLRTTARMTAFSPGQSPPPVSKPTRTFHAPCWPGSSKRYRRRGLRMSFWLSGLGKQAHLALEVARASEAFVHTGEAQIGHVIDGPQALQHSQTDLLAGDLWALHTQAL